MAETTVPCPHCQEPMPAGLDECPACGRPVPLPGGDAPARPATPVRQAERPPMDLEERMARLEQWREAGERLGVEISALPSWAAARARREPMEGWVEFLEAAEAEAAGKVTARLIAWEQETLGRLRALEEYGIDGRLEREQVEDAVATGRAGEIARAVAIVHQVDRVLTLKERHLALARQELDRLLELLRDLSALSLNGAYDPREVAEELEPELRKGRLAALKQQLRAMRLDIVRQLKTGFPEQVGRLGGALGRAREQGRDVSAPVDELARCARAYVEGRPDEAIRRLRLLGEAWSASGDPVAARGAPTGPSRRA
jgi:hypothetical protein